MEKIEYHETAATRNMHALPRFGYPNDFALLLGTQEQRSEYIYGLLFAGVFIYAWFIAWCTILLIFKCLRGKVGFLSGNPMRVPYGSKKPLIIRIVFVISTIMVVTFSALLVTEGLTQLKTGVGTVYDSSVEVNRILAEVEEFANALDEVGKVAQPLTDELVSKLANGSFCPGVDLNSATGVNFDSIVNDAVVFLDEVDNFTLPRNEEAQETLKTAQDTTEKVETTSDNISVQDWQSLIFIVPFSIFAFLFLVGVALVWLDRNVAWYTCILSWVVLPLFIILIVICFLCSGAIAIAASANADFCSGGDDNTPTGTITQILELNGYTPSNLTYQVVDFYIWQCEATNPLDFITSFESALEQADAAVKEFENAILNVTVDELAALCGGDILLTESLARQLVNGLGRLVGASLSILSILSCETIVPLYTTTFYNGTCEYSVQGVTWTFASFLVIAVFGMLMITFRSAYLPVEDADLYKFDGEEAPMEYNEALEVEYDPSNALSLKESNVEESYGLSTEQPIKADDTGANVVMGVAVGAAAGVAVAGAASYGSSSMQGGDTNQLIDGSAGQGDSSQQSPQQQNDPVSFDDENWLGDPAPVGAQY